MTPAEALALWLLAAVVIGALWSAAVAFLYQGPRS